MWKLGRGRVLLDEPPEEEDGLRGGPPPAAAAAQAQVQGASFRGWKEVTSLFNKDDEQHLLERCKSPKSKGYAIRCLSSSTLDRGEARQQLEAWGPAGAVSEASPLPVTCVSCCLAACALHVPAHPEEFPEVENSSSYGQLCLRIQLNFLPKNLS
ncbi:testis development-related protein isoform X5 [Papio anubis]|uniref:testis development-related protein isoform X5 n=1 Tax=Papio anubis TaxID=9555 RepID=UPI00083EDF05|nr:testis development-related protein isoform X5 [Papio anubis]